LFVLFCFVFLTGSNKYLISHFTFIGEVLLPLSLLFFSFSSNHLKNDRQLNS